jgi:hypothetical protein
MHLLELKMNRIVSSLNSVLRFYSEGFKNMSGWGRKVWIIIIIKLFIMFAILKIFFFQDFLKSKYDTDKQRSEYVLDQLINSKDKK